MANMEGKNLVISAEEDKKTLEETKKVTPDDLLEIFPEEEISDDIRIEFLEGIPDEKWDTLPEEVRRLIYKELTPGYPEKFIDNILYATSMRWGGDKKKRYLCSLIMKISDEKKREFIFEQIRASPEELDMEMVDEDNIIECGKCTKYVKDGEEIILLNCYHILCSHCYQTEKHCGKCVLEVKSSFSDIWGTFLGPMVFFLVAYGHLFIDGLFFPFVGRCFTLGRTAKEKCLSFFSAVGQLFSTKMFGKNEQGMMKVACFHIIFSCISYSLGLEFPKFIINVKMGVIAIGLVIIPCFLKKLHLHFESQLDHYKTICKENGFSPTVE